MNDVHDREHVVGVDSYNLCITGEIGRTLATPSGGLNEHIPVVLGCDVYNFEETGDIACCLTANSGVPNTAGPKVIILNDQGGSVMDTSENVAATLRAQDHGHPPVACYSLCNHDASVNEHITETIRAECHGALPVVCFEPGILRRDCSAGNRAYMDICSTLRAQMGDNQPAVAYAIDHVVTTGGNCTAQGPCYYKDICPTEKASGVHAVCYEVGDNNGL